MFLQCGSVSFAEERAIVAKSSRSALGNIQQALDDTCCSVQRSADDRAVLRERVARPAALKEAPPALPAELLGSGEEREPGPEEEPGEGDPIKVRVLVVKAVGLPQAEDRNSYVEMRLVSGDPFEQDQQGGQKKRKGKSRNEKVVFKAATQVIRNSLEPAWEESFVFEVPASDTTADLCLHFRVYDRGVISQDDCIGHVSLSLFEALQWSKQLNAGWHALLRSSTSVADRLGLLRDERLPTAPPYRCGLKPAPTQEKSYDLAKAALFLHAEQTKPLRGGGSPVQRTRRNVGRPLLSGSEQHVLRGQLVQAAADGSTPRCRRLLDRGMSADTCALDGPFVGCAILHIACLKGHRDLAMALVDVFGASLLQLAPGGRSAPMCACEAGSEALVEWLITEGVPADLRDSTGRTILFHAVRWAMPELTARLLSKRWCSHGDRAKDGSTALMEAASSGLPEAATAVRHLLEAKASANIVDHAGRSPLHAACKAGDENVIKLMLGMGAAKANVADKTGQTPADLARMSGLPEATVRKLARAGPPESSGSPDANSSRTRTAEEMRGGQQLRARQSDPDEWRTWRALHPRRGPGADRGAGVGELAGDLTSGILAPALDEGFFLVGLDLGSGGMEAAASEGQGGGNSSKPSQNRGRLGRLKGWLPGMPRTKQGHAAAASSAADEDPWSAFDHDSPRF